MMRYSSFLRSPWAIATALWMALAPLAASRAEGEDPGGNNGGDNQVAPQFDLATAGAAFTLLAGSFLVLKARRQRRKAR
jgi:hypothetical protein